MASHGEKHHPYHLVNPSPWPIVGAFALLMLALGGAMFMHQKPGGSILALVGFALVLYVMFAWWRDVIREGMHDHAHTPAVSRGLRFGMALFITSEVMFFVAFFWAFFDSSVLPKAPVTDVWNIAQGVWPPKGIKVFDPFHLPFLNTLILLLSGTTVTWAHYSVVTGNKKEAIQSLWMTVILGLIFTSCQAFEYSHAAFGFKDGVYASTFFMATGFHGLHVIIGTLFLAVCLCRVYKDQFTPQQHLGFEFAAWYWHFVDVVWLFLFIFIYGDMANKLMPAFEAIFTPTNMIIAFFLSMLVAGAAGYYLLAKGGLPKPKAAHH